MKNPLRIEGPDPPEAYPPQRVRLWLLAAWIGSADADEAAGPKPGDKRVQRWPELYVADWRMKAQLKAWLNAQAGREPSFREACRQNGWRSREHAMRGVEMAIRLIAIGLNVREPCDGIRSETGAAACKNLASKASEMG